MRERESMRVIEREGENKAKDETHVDPSHHFMHRCTAIDDDNGKSGDLLAQS